MSRSEEWHRWWYGTKVGKHKQCALQVLSSPFQVWSCDMVDEGDMYHVTGTNFGGVIRKRLLKTKEEIM